MIIPKNFPEDLVDYIHSLIIYEQDKELLYDIRLFINSKNKFINIYKKDNENHNEFMKKISKNILNLMYNNENIVFKLPKHILKNYINSEYNTRNEELLLTLSAKIDPDVLHSESVKAITEPEPNPTISSL